MIKTKWWLTIKRLWRYLLRARHLRIVRYLMVGCTNMSICFLFMYLGALAGLHYLQYTIVGYFFSILYSFYMNLRFTFRVSGHITRRLLLFFMVNLSNLAMVTGIEYVMIDIWHCPHLLAILSAMFWYSLVGFIINTLFVYRPRLEA